MQFVARTIGHYGTVRPGRVSRRFPFRARTRLRTITYTQFALLFLALAVLYFTPR